MPLDRIEHFFVSTDDIEATRRFYCDVLGLTVGPRPELSFPGYWLYSGDVPCIHVGEREAYGDYAAATRVPFSERAAGTGPIDHIAFNARGFDEMRAQLDAAGTDYRDNRLDEFGLRQLFVKDPNGITIELNFRAD